MTGAAILAPQGGPEEGDGRAGVKGKAGKDRREIDVGWKEFLEQCVPVAERLHRDSSRSGQDAYLYWLASMVVRLRTREMPRAKLGRFGPSSRPSTSA